MKTFIVYWTERGAPNRENNMIVNAANEDFAYEQWQVRAQFSRRNCKSFRIVEV